MPRLIDLSMEVLQGMMTYPNVAKPVIVEMETYSQMAQSVGTDKYGVNEITNHERTVRQLFAVDPRRASAATRPSTSRPSCRPSGS